MAPRLVAGGALMCAAALLATIPPSAGTIVLPVGVGTMTTPEDGISACWDFFLPGSAVVEGITSVPGAALWTLSKNGVLLDEAYRADVVYGRDIDVDPGDIVCIGARLADDADFTAVSMTVTQGPPET